MNPTPQSTRLLQSALNRADETKAVEIGSGKLAVVGKTFRSLFGRCPAAVVADANTWPAAGDAVSQVLGDAGIETIPPLVWNTTALAADDEEAQWLAGELEKTSAIPIALGSGTINDLTKYASHCAGRPYLAVATAASMDGYTAPGASLTSGGAKRTLTCPAALAVVVDTRILADAPAELNAAGYADLAAKVVSGADWILADALGIEPIDETAWAYSQTPLRDWIADPAGIRRGDESALAELAAGLLMTGFAMQRHKSSRPASGAEHQFSHLWDMQHHTHHGRAPLHGHKVGIGALCSASLYERLLKSDPSTLDIPALLSRHPDWSEIERQIDAGVDSQALREVAKRESRAKAITADELEKRLRLLCRIWPELRVRLKDQLLPAPTLQEMLRDAGAPDRPEQIGLTAARLRASFDLARRIRRRYTILDLAAELGRLEEWAAEPFVVTP